MYKIWLIGALSALSWPNITDIKLTHIPNNPKVFGFFSTIKRPQGNVEEVHGCIGQWTHNFDQADYNTINMWIKETAISAAYKDNRKNNFSKGLDRDILATFELSFLLLPLMSVHNGIIESKRVTFDNTKYGLLVVSKRGNAATFLPHVFPASTSWEDISADLISKNSSNNVTNTFYAYTTKEILFSFKTIFDKDYGYKNYWFQIMHKWVHLLNTHKNLYMIANNKYISDETETVRNFAVASINIAISKLLNIPINYNINVPYSELTEANEIANYVILLSHAQQPIPDLLKEKLKYSIKNWRSLEPEFTLGQVIIAHSLINNVANDADDVVENITDIITYWTATPAKSIFELNWRIQAVYYIKSQHKDIYDIHNLIKKMYVNLMGYQNQITKGSETNYIAVAFEAASFLDALLDQEDIGLMNFRFYMMNLLQKYRYDGSIGAYGFIDKSYRMDITGHVMSGLLSTII